MCGRFWLASPADALARAFRVRAPAPVPPRYNIAPGQPILAVRLADEDSGTATPEGGRELVAMVWGLVPGWMKQRPGGRAMINARVETVGEKPAFRAAFRRRRCLVPADGWYEWQAQGDRPKQPFAIAAAQAGVPAAARSMPQAAAQAADQASDPGARPLAFAGIWERWHGPGGDDWLETVAILTRPAVSSLAAIHDRMPVVLSPGGQDAWLGDTGLAVDPVEVARRGAVKAEGAFRAWPVSRRVNAVRTDDAGLITPVEAGRDGPLQGSGQDSAQGSGQGSGQAQGDGSSSAQGSLF
ncbi:hypothetical protein CCR85_04355 [Rhodothalassium salexigens]|uniref:SOS response-associated peptidase n=1 Tax=Rhodothalassium salexigens TaxID=1086 RepID=UPI001911618E|nr:SOS response-associated peptidase [Rhodothalassium salexigens]MBK5910724.1 hypothetical protein [Rhodothalassium salexigens]